MLKISLSTFFGVCALGGIYLAWIAITSAHLEEALNQFTDGAVPTDTTAPDARWQTVAQDAQNLASFASWDPAVLDLAGRVWFFGAEHFSETPKEEIAKLRIAQSFLDRAAKLRPTWPYTWLNLARVEFALDANGSWSSRLSTALDCNLRGTFLQLDLMRFRKRLGVHLNSDLARRVEQSFEQALKDDPDQIVRDAVRIGRREWACAQPVSQRVKELCSYN